MKISIIAVGRISNSFESDLVNRYINRFNKINKLHKSTRPSSVECNNPLETEDTTIHQ